MIKIMRTKRGKYKGLEVRAGQIMLVPDSDAQAMVAGNVGEFVEKAPVNRMRKVKNAK